MDEGFHRGRPEGHTELFEGCPVKAHVIDDYDDDYMYTNEYYTRRRGGGSPRGGRTVRVEWLVTSRCQRPRRRGTAVAALLACAVAPRWEGAMSGAVLQGTHSGPAPAPPSSPLLSDTPSPR